MVEVTQNTLDFLEEFPYANKLKPIWNKYTSNTSKIDEKSNLSDHKEISAALKVAEKSDRRKIIEIIKTLPIIPCRVKGKTLVEFKKPDDVYLPEKYTHDKLYEDFFKKYDMIEKVTFLYGEAGPMYGVDLLIEMGCRCKLDILSEIEKNILPLYQSSKVTQPLSENTTHIQCIYDAVKDPNQYLNIRDFFSFLDKVKTAYLFLSINLLTKNRFWSRSQDIYLPKVVTQKDDLEHYFNNDPTVCFLLNRYAFIDRSTLQRLGMREQVKISARKKEPNEKYLLLKQERGSYQRSTGFDPECQMEGLKNTKTSMDYRKSFIIWNMVIAYSDQLFGSVELAKSKTFTDKKDIQIHSVMGMLLNEIKWLPKKGDTTTFFAPKEISFTDLPEEYLVLVNGFTNEEKLKKAFLFREDRTEEYYLALPERDRTVLGMTKYYSIDDIRFMIELFENRKDDINKQTDEKTPNYQPELFS